MFIRILLLTFMGGQMSSSGAVESSQAIAVPTSLTAADYPYELAVADGGVQYDPKYPGTAVVRLASVLKRVRETESFDGSWPDVRRRLLAAGGLKEDYSTSHAFNDDNHCDLTTMESKVQFQQNTNGAVAQISRRNQLAPHIQQASLTELGPGGSWSTCTNGAHSTPPNDVAHTQFSSRVAFKLVWVPQAFTEFVLVDDEGRLLRRGKPTGSLPSLNARKRNYGLVQGGKYAMIADEIAAGKLTDPGLAQVCDAATGL
jgi:hypothetical protein